ncbi:hypothetical protein DICPUDRAFT_34073 [Dictyostelium purpureum]|uniref:Uncharacterized protein n=1 Tax=Dictyostelium purpureum TaxID=5786 RepID=F0ZM12_DICPU|nr:uncharacterized protein DICPUDRAFT_34073 [Dictyostelium purpureum]EGC35031.1 hypothetical protein DICPUDRAFT_34073 [Dictyostelium purpureum]|eukprot:XP_003288459.1 hypothetical protein DICPUDRAFT_34073 [Dictyostelium purpureum]
MNRFINSTNKLLIPSLKNNVLISSPNLTVQQQQNYYTGGNYNYPPVPYWGMGGNPAAMHSDPYRMKSTTILSVRRNGKVVIIGDGQCTLGHSIVKPNAKKIRKLADGKIIAGFAGSVGDAFTLFELLEKKLAEHRGLLLKSCVELAQQWRTDKYYRRLEASIIVADKDITLTLDGNGDVLEPNDGILAIGSGGDFALSAARALLTVPDIDPEEIAKRSMKIAADICIYTNHNFVMEVLTSDSNENNNKNDLSSPFPPSPSPSSSSSSPSNTNTVNTNSNITDSIVSTTLSTGAIPLDNDNSNSNNINIGTNSDLGNITNDNNNQDSNNDK